MPNKGPAVVESDILEQDVLSFSIEGRIVRELGERLVRASDVALLELVKNSFDADAEWCEISVELPSRIVVEDNGHGMTIDDFRTAWMRIGTSAKESRAESPIYKRTITGEKGIGRFAVRYLGTRLTIRTVANDPRRGVTALEATFDWPSVDRHEDLGQVRIPYTLAKAPNEKPGTTLTITELRKAASDIPLHKVRTGAVTNLSPYKPLLDLSPFAKRDKERRARELKKGEQADPGFSLRIKSAVESGGEDQDVAEKILSNFVSRCVIRLDGNRLRLQVWASKDSEARLDIQDRYDNSIGPLYADLRFFPWRKGVFKSTGVDGPIARSWVRDRSGIAVFDRGFRVHPYGMAGDDWLHLMIDRSHSERDPRSKIAKKHFPMSDQEHGSTQLNYMLRLPYNEQLVGIVQVQGRRSRDPAPDDEGLVAAADREGFIDNEAFNQLTDIVRGGVEGIAYVDRQLQQDELKREEDELRRELRRKTRRAIKEIEANPRLSAAEKKRYVERLLEFDRLESQRDEVAATRQSALEIMSLMGVIAGFMTHEFGAAISALEDAGKAIKAVEKRVPEASKASKTIAESLLRLNEFVTYSQGYIRGATAEPEKLYPAKPRIQQVIRVFGRYAQERQIQVSVDVDSDLKAPRVPVSLYNGIVLNLYTNALKAITARTGPEERRISFRAWIQKNVHVLTVSDTGVGIPSSMRERIFDPLFTTTEANQDPLGSGMGLGLTLVDRCVRAFKGKVQVVTPPPGFTTCFRVELPMEAGG